MGRVAPGAPLSPAHYNNAAIACRLLACLAAIGGCAGTKGQAEVPTLDGIYDFTTRTGEVGELRGRLVVVGGELSMEPDQGICRVDAAFVSFERQRFLCDNTSEVEDLALVVDRRFPLTSSIWTGIVQRTRTRQVCVAYATRDGRQVCVRTETQTYRERAAVRGPLTFRRRPAG